MIDRRCINAQPSRPRRLSAMKRDMPQVSAEAPMTDPIDRA
jgi:hypothetical protein